MWQPVDAAVENGGEFGATMGASSPASPVVKKSEKKPDWMNS